MLEKAHLFLYPIAMENEATLSKKERSEIKKESKLKRIWELDFLRGVLIIAMIVDHIFCTLGRYGFINNFMTYDGTLPNWYMDVYNFSNTVWLSYFRCYGRYFLMFLLFFISGACSKFSKNNMSRGIKITVVGLLMFIVTWIMSLCGIDYLILFGTILCFGVSILIYAIYEKLIKKIFKNPASFKWATLFLGIIFILIGVYFGVISDIIENTPSVNNVGWVVTNTPNLGDGYFEGSDILHYLRPQVLPKEDLNISNFFLVIAGRYYYGDDWLGLFPSLGYFFIGVFFAEIMYTKERLEKRVEFDKKINRITAPINFFGYHSLKFYLGHMVLIYVVLMIPFLFMGWRLNI